MHMRAKISILLQVKTFLAEKTVVLCLEGNSVLVKVRVGCSIVSKSLESVFYQ